jgi:hypothetical protein
MYYIYIYITRCLKFYIYDFKHRVLKIIYVFNDSEFVLCCVIFVLCGVLFCSLMLRGAFFLILSNNVRIGAGLKEGRSWSGMSPNLWIIILILTL